MADDLNDLPESDTDYSQDEQKVVETYYEQGQKQTRPKKGTNWKFIMYAVVLFVLFANPYTDDMLDKISYFEGSAIIKFGVKTVLFLVAFFLLDRYVK
jgi:hypothetical protein